jgi:hypothetical protein
MLEDINRNKLLFCSNAQQYYIDKSLTDVKLKNYKWNGTAWA